MSQENVERIRAALAALNRGDIDAALNDAAPDFELDFSRAVGPVHGVYRLDQIREALDELIGVWESVRIQADEFIEAGEQVVVPQTGYVRGRDGIETTARITLVWTLRDGAITRICMYQEREEALEAAGLQYE
jgi:ketosteroid isomerase-like protein